MVVLMQSPKSMDTCARYPSKPLFMRVCTVPPCCPLLVNDGLNARILGRFTHFLRKHMNTTHKFCSKCGAHRPLADFKRLLTRAQMKARGYLGHVRMEIESKLCKDCQPRAKPLEQLTIKQLRNRVASGDLNEMLADSIIKERRASVNARRARATSSRWAQLQHGVWKTLVCEIGMEITVLRQQQKYANRINDPLRKKYTTEYLGLLNRLRARMRMQLLKPRETPHSSVWIDHLHQEEINQVRSVWEVIPLETRARMKVPLALRHRAKPEAEVRPVLTLKAKDYVSPAERIAQGG